MDDNEAPTVGCVCCGRELDRKYENERGEYGVLFWFCDGSGGLKEHETGTGSACVMCLDCMAKLCQIIARTGRKTLDLPPRSILQ